jgi:hypothetical protein
MPYQVRTALPPPRQATDHFPNTTLQEGRAPLTMVTVNTINAMLARKFITGTMVTKEYLVFTMKGDDSRDKFKIKKDQIDMLMLELLKSDHDTEAKRINLKILTDVSKQLE